MVLSATISYAPQLTLRLFMCETRSGLFYIGNNVFEKKIMVSEESKMSVTLFNVSMLCSEVTFKFSLYGLNHTDPLFVSSCIISGDDACYFKLISVSI